MLESDVQRAVRAVLDRWSAEERAAALKILREAENDHRSPAARAGVLPSIR